MNGRTDLWRSMDEHEESFWPSFTDIMMVVLMTFLLVTVAVIISNTRLLKDLRQSVAAQEEASQRAEFTLKENATLEEQLDYFQRQLASTEMELLRSRAITEQTQAQLTDTQQQLRSVQQQASQQASQLQQRQAEVTSLQASAAEQTSLAERLQTELRQAQRTLATETSRLETELAQTKEAQASETEQLRAALAQTQADLTRSQAESTERETALNSLRAEVEASREELLSLEGDYAELDKKYQKLLKPSRSAKGKTVVDVMYQRSGYSIRAPGDSSYRGVSASELDNQLSALKNRHGNDLYVKIIIPENSGLSYNQAWAFTRDTLAKYDYYYQEDASRPAEDVLPAEE